MSRSGPEDRFCCLGSGFGGNPLKTSAGSVNNHRTGTDSGVGSVPIRTQMVLMRKRKVLVVVLIRPGSGSMSTRPTEQNPVNVEPARWNI